MTNTTATPLPTNWKTFSTSVATEHWEHIEKVRLARKPALDAIAKQFETVKNDPIARQALYRSLESNTAANVEYTVSPRYETSPRAIREAAVCAHQLYVTRNFQHTLRIPLISAGNLVGRVKNEALFMAITLLIPTLILAIAAYIGLAQSITLPFGGVEVVGLVFVAGGLFSYLENTLFRAIKIARENEKAYRQHQYQVGRVAAAFDLKSADQLEPGQVLELERIYQAIQANKARFADAVSMQNRRESVGDSAPVQLATATQTVLAAAMLVDTETGEIFPNNSTDVPFITGMVGEQLMTSQGVDIYGMPAGCAFDFGSSSDHHEV